MKSRMNQVIKWPGVLIPTALRIEDGEGGPSGMIEEFRRMAMHLCE